ncbi:MAG: cytochrome ubiquinol oxidase subunit I, partial [Caldimonas sp.]
PVPALKDFAPRDRPNSTIVFWSFRVMVGLGFLMIALGLWAAWSRWRGSLYRSRALLRSVLGMGPAGLVALLAGWFTTEVGRQPWIVYGVMRTADGVSPHSAAQLGISLALFVVVYFVVFGAGAVYMLRLIAHVPVVNPDESQAPGGPGQLRQAMRPLSAAFDDDHDAGGAPVARAPA